MASGKRVLLIVGGGIAAYKALELVRLLRKRGIAVRAVLTKAGEEFVTPLSLSALTEDKVYTDLFSLTDEAEMGHIQLSRSADLIVVAPATADLLAKMRAGLAGDLASTLLLATDTPVLAAPAMNVRMWTHAATQENVKVLTERGISFIGPDEGDMACGEFGPGRMAEPAAIAEAVAAQLDPASKPLAGKRAVVTSGPTYEPIDPVRYIANRSSGKQGHAIAAALAAAGAEVTLVTGPTREPDPAGVTVQHIETARQMLSGVEAALPADIAIFAAAVADWRVAEEATQKLKKDGSGDIPALSMTENPDILKTVSGLDGKRPALVIGFAAETENVIPHATEKRARKGCDWIMANDVSPATGTFGGDANTIHLITGDGAEDWPTLSKKEVAAKLATRITEHFTA
ncbi:bifunctional phosphopantothenoylcysteine decarboxylase/phosphopantothenate--cysteine ligase CoaBC [Nisaea nitritireducens]|uniref:bifunctional phosphopantothenoylcysteine decarboxylase/phosphopantothenate--cysteine ligase CoaBC n=1 Tax=Nisaea nitritireducens TaxID=568392 RepID=UPI001868B520|nr:bifunctional phosphopantothenoylcysteine decarboxylase/phosphopantothenate--cysteine ligase CoaBC [Nisaea nitritireducens]